MCRAEWIFNCFWGLGYDFFYVGFLDSWVSVAHQGFPCDPVSFDLIKTFPTVFLSLFLLLFGKIFFFNCVVYSKGFGWINSGSGTLFVFPSKKRKKETLLYALYCKCKLVFLVVDFLSQLGFKSELFLACFLFCVGIFCCYIANSFPDRLFMFRFFF